jgi:hypothetical protein
MCDSWQDVAAGRAEPVMRKAPLLFAVMPAVIFFVVLQL